MTRKAAARYGLSLCGVSMFLGSAVVMAAEPADLLRVHRKVLTVDSSFSIASTAAIEDGRIVAVGGDDLAARYIANPSCLTWEEKQKGTLEAGKLADLIVLDSDPRAVPPEKLLTLKSDLTIVGGKIVYQRPGA